jgi:hypothetical protein
MGNLEENKVRLELTINLDNIKADKKLITFYTMSFLSVVILNVLAVYFLLKGQ